MTQAKSSETSRILMWLFVLGITILIIGTYGFHYISRLNWIDSFHNASMYASGMGPLFKMKTNEAKIFSSIYALIASLFFIAIVAALIQRTININLFGMLTVEEKD